MKRVFSQTFCVVGAILEKDGKFLLVKEAKNTSDKGKWNQPAGWLDVGEIPLAAVKREVQEEAGYDFTPTHILGVYSIVRRDLAKAGEEIRHPVKIIFRGVISGEQSPKLADDISETHWFAPEEIEQMDKKILRDLDIKKMIKDYLSDKKYPLELISHTISE